MKLEHFINKWGYSIDCDEIKDMRAYLKSDLNNMLKTEQKTNRKKPLVSLTEKLVYQKLNVLKSDMSDKSKKRVFVIARDYIWYLCYTNLGMTNSDELTYLGSLFNRDRTTVIHSIKKTRKFLGWDKDLQKEINWLTNKFNSTKTVEN